MRKKEHILERRLEMVKQRYERRLQLMKDAATIGDRPMFQVALSEREQLERYNDPMLRPIIMARIEQMEGPEAVTRYQLRMYELAEKLKDKAMKTGRI